MAIDIGAEAIDRNFTMVPYYTMLGLDNPANGEGTIDTFEVWADTSITGCIAGTFFLVGGTTYQCRDSEAIGSVTSGSKQTFSGLSVAVSTGDLPGCYYTGGKIERSTSGCGGLRYIAGKYIDPDDQADFAGLSDDDAISLYGTGVEGGGATEKQSADTGTGADARTAGNPLAAIGASETGSGTDSLPARDMAQPDSGSGVDSLVSLQTPAAKTASDSGSGTDALVSLQVPQPKTSSDAGSGVETILVYSASVAGSESGSGIEALITRLLAAAEAGYGAEASEIGGGGLLKHLLGSELGEGADGLTAKIEIPNKGGGMRLWT